MSGTPDKPTSSDSRHQPNHGLSRQLNTEAKWSIYLTLLYMAGWVMFGYFMPNRTGVLGFPLWFELSCLFLPLVFILISMAVLKLVYQDIDLDGHFGDSDKIDGSDFDDFPHQSNQ